MGNPYIALELSEQLEKALIEHERAIITRRNALILIEQAKEDIAEAETKIVKLVEVEKRIQEEERGQGLQPGIIRKLAEQRLEVLRMANLLPAAGAGGLMLRRKIGRPTNEARELRRMAQGMSPEEAVAPAVRRKPGRPPKGTRVIGRTDQEGGYHADLQESSPATEAYAAPVPNIPAVQPEPAVANVSEPQAALTDTATETPVPEGVTANAAAEITTPVQEISPEDAAIAAAFDLDLDLVPAPAPAPAKPSGPSFMP